MASTLNTHEQFLEGRQVAEQAFLDNFELIGEVVLNFPNERPPAPVTTSLEECLDGLDVLDGRKHLFLSKTQEAMMGAMFVEPASGRTITNPYHSGLHVVEVDFGLDNDSTTYDSVVDVTSHEAGTITSHEWLCREPSTSGGPHLRLNLNARMFALEEGVRYHEDLATRVQRAQDAKGLPEFISRALKYVGGRRYDLAEAFVPSSGSIHHRIFTIESPSNSTT